MSIEIVSRSCDKNKLAHLRKLGFNRVSFGVQDFNVEVQLAINRVQPLQLVHTLVNEARRLRFQSVNLDIVYGLPHQTSTNFARTLTTLLSLQRDRVSI